MNLVVLAAALIIASEASNDSGSYRDSNVSATIQYASVDRNGNLLAISVSSGDPFYGPYYGRDRFYYEGRRYYRYYEPRRVVVVRDPVVYVPHRYYDDRDKDYWKAVREHDKRWAKVEIERDKRWSKADRGRDVIYAEVRGGDKGRSGNPGKGNKGNKGSKKGKH